LIGIFLTRFFIELVKVNQESFEEGMLLNMGQLLSVPFIIMAAVVIWLGVNDRLPVARPEPKKRVGRKVNVK
jgi:prolipoprotein diacylglyceryltransferase